MSHSKATRTRTTLIRLGATTLGLVLLLMWLEGAFEPKTAPGLSAADPSESRSSGGTARVERREAEELFNWPGAVTARTVTQVAPKLSGRILDITVRAGDAVKRGQVLARIDAGAARARLAQARATLTAAEAEAHRARADARRYEHLYEREAATRQDLDTARAASGVAEARVTETRAAIREAESALQDTVLPAPFDSVVVKRLHEPGDMALPGVPLLTLHQSQFLRVEAAIPAACADKVAIGSQLTARLAGPAEELRVVVDEIQPAADPQTHTVLVKARLPAGAAAQPGAFAWLRQPCGHASVLLAPAAAIARIGQLESVRLVIDHTTKLRHVRTGKRYGDAVEILSGLSEGDTVRIPGER